MSNPIPSGVALLAQLEGEANGRGKTTVDPFIPSTSTSFDWGTFAECIRDAIDNADGEISSSALKHALKKYGYVVFEWVGNGKQEGVPHYRASKRK